MRPRPCHRPPLPIHDVDLQPALRRVVPLQIATSKVVALERAAEVVDQKLDATPRLQHVQQVIDEELGRADAEWDGLDPDELDPTFEEDAEFRARWPRLYRQGPLDRT